MSDKNTGRKVGEPPDTNMRTCSTCGGNVLLLPDPASSGQEAKCVQCGRTAFNTGQPASQDARYYHRRRKAG